MHGLIFENMTAGSINQVASPHRHNRPMLQQHVHEFAFFPSKPSSFMRMISNLNTRQANSCPSEKVFRTEFLAQGYTPSKFLVMAASTLPVVNNASHSASTLFAFKSRRFVRTCSWSPTGQDVLNSNLTRMPLICFMPRVLSLLFGI